MESKNETNLPITWGAKLAQELVPDEIDRAPFIVEDYVKGGRTRKKLLQQPKGNALGGFGLEGFVLLPWLLHALNLATPFLGGLLTSKTIDSVRIIHKEITSLLVAHKHNPQERMKVALTDPLAQQCIASLTQTLHMSGLSIEMSESLALELLTFLLKDPTNAAKFLQTLREHT